MGNRQETPKRPKTPSLGQDFCVEVEESMYNFAFFKKILTFHANNWLKVRIF
jgi:hypothetical protein